MKRILSALLLAGVLLQSAAQSAYPGQHAGKFAVKTSVPLKAEALKIVTRMGDWAWNKLSTLSKVEVTYPMSLTVETAPDDPSRGALLYGPVVLAGERGTEGMTSPAPFSNPALYNDYYTYNYNIPDDIATSINPATVRRGGETLKFTTPDGDSLLPLYDLHRQRYVVYWNLTK